jgi:hypothetical protein
MAFKVTHASVDLVNNRGALTLSDAIDPPNGKWASVQIQFPFAPPHTEETEKEKLIAEAKRCLQRALAEF